MALHLTSCERQLDVDRVVATGLASWMKRAPKHPGIRTKYVPSIVREVLVKALEEYAA